MERCGRCGRELKNEQSIKDGMGKVCKEKTMAAKALELNADKHDQEDQESDQEGEG